MLLNAAPWLARGSFVEVVLVLTADDFASVSSLAQRKAFGIEFHKSLSAAIAIQAGTTLPERELFARRLSDFAYSSRDVGDKVRCSA